MRVLCQLAPRIGEGTGVGGVAAGLGRAFAAAGLDVQTFTLADTAYRAIPTPNAAARRLEHALEVVYFSTVGTARARARLRRDPEAWSICHNDLLAGDIYVNHGLLRVAMESRDHPALRMLRNPLHLFTQARDWWRFNHSHAHRAVVHLTEAERRSFHRLYPRSALRCAVIGNGVDTQEYRPPTADEFHRARLQFGLPADAFIVCFVGHEFARKGLDLLLAALPRLPHEVHLAVAGGTSRERSQRAAIAAATGVADRVHFLGVLSDSRQLLHASDLLALPSAYEAYSLVVLEALACGVPVLSTPVGAAPELLVDGGNGFLVEPTTTAVTDAVLRAMHADRDHLRQNARTTAAAHSWQRVAEQYIELLTDLHQGAEPSEHAAAGR